MCVYVYACTCLSMSQCVRYHLETGKPIKKFTQENPVSSFQQVLVTTNTKQLTRTHCPNQMCNTPTDKRQKRNGQSNNVAVECRSTNKQITRKCIRAEWETHLRTVHPKVDVTSRNRTGGLPLFEQTQITGVNTQCCSNHYSNEGQQLS